MFIVKNENMKLRPQFEATNWEQIFKDYPEVCIVLYEYLTGRKFKERSDTYSPIDEFINALELFSVKNDIESLKYFLDKFNVTFWQEKSDDNEYKAISFGFNRKIITDEISSLEEAVIRSVTNCLRMVNDHIKTHYRRSVDNDEPKLTGS